MAEKLAVDLVDHLVERKVDWLVVLVHLWVVLKAGHWVG